MAKSKKKQIKQTKYKYNTKVGGTDYDIPSFGYKSAFIIILAIFIPVLCVPAICSFLQIDYRIPTIILTGIMAGLAVAFTQFCMERKIGITKSFWIVAFLVGLFSAGVVFMLIYVGILM